MLYFNLTFSSVCNIFISLHTSKLLHNTHFYDFDRMTDSPYGRRILIIEHFYFSRTNKNHKNRKDEHEVKVIAFDISEQNLLNFGCNDSEWQNCAWWLRKLHFFPFHPLPSVSMIFSVTYFSCMNSTYISTYIFIIIIIIIMIATTV